MPTVNVASYRPKMVTLYDGRQVPDDSEEWRHECEARAVIAMPTLAQRRAYLRGTMSEAGFVTGGVLQRRGQAAVERLERTIKQIWYSEQRSG